MRTREEINKANAGNGNWGGWQGQQNDFIIELLLDIRDLLAAPTHTDHE